MSLTQSEEQAELRKVTRRFLERECTPRLRALMGTESGLDAALWAQMAEELGLLGLHLPERYGGQGFSFVESAIVFEEMGRALLCAPYLSSCLASCVVLSAGTEDQRAELLPQIAGGGVVVAVALTEDSGRWEPTAISLAATRTPKGWRLSGTKMFVLDGHAADTLIVAARQTGTEGVDGVSLFLVPGDSAGVHRTPLATMDPTRKQARLEFRDAAAVPLGTPGQGWEPLSAALDQAAVFLSAEILGGAQRCLDMAVEYAKTRVQFGRPIGSFQAIKHKCADMLLLVESARSAVHQAAWMASQGSADLPAVASIAKSYCADAYMRVAGENVQIHGGIGFTWEHDAHLYFKRAKASQVLFGDSRYHRARVAELVGIR